MLPNPLHPAVVHFPIVFAVLLPIAAVVALWLTRGRSSPGRTWAVPLAFAAALTASAWVAVETGEEQEEKVESIVSESVLHDHQRAAERFLVLGGVVTLVAAAGLLAGPLGTASRLIATLGAFLLLAAGVQVGAMGGELVYRHGAAGAYVQVGSGTSTLGDGELAGEEREHSSHQREGSEGR